VVGRGGDAVKICGVYHPGSFPGFILGVWYRGLLMLMLLALLWWGLEALGWRKDGVVGVGGRGVGSTDRWGPGLERCP